jgi:hypothetical protein
LGRYDYFLFYRVFVGDFAELFCSSFITYTLKSYLPNKLRHLSPSKTPYVLGVIISVVLLLLLTTTGFVSVWAATLFGTSGPDTIVGTNNDDDIYGLAGNDNLRGNGGNDNIYGQEDNDRINDGLGNDQISAGSGDDTINLGKTGQSGFDRGAQDVVYGEKGKDNINAQGSSSFLLIYGGDDDDIFLVEVGAMMGEFMAAMEMTTSRAAVTGLSMSGLAPEMITSMVKANVP